MGSEDGEVIETNTQMHSEIAENYDLAYEWPGDASCADSSILDSPSCSQAPATFRPNQPAFRLVVLRTSILSPRHKIAIIDGRSEVQFGRDVLPVGSRTPKIRLKEMAVSKLHATAYWDATRREWSVVDMGSMHGTFLRSPSAPKDDIGVRLSPARQASIPRKLSHSDQLTIGGTTFIVHMHESRLPCEQCWASSQDEIPLFPVSKSAKFSPGATGRVVAGEDSSTPGFYSAKPLNDPKQALTMLKQSLLMRHSDSKQRPKSAPHTEYPLYVDRSARRRALIQATSLDAPGVTTPPTSTWSDTPPRPQSPPPKLVSQPPTPLPSSNVGHRLLMKQGWEPGTALGSHSDGSNTGLVEPIEVNASVDRAGLGVKRCSLAHQPDFPDSDWRETSKRRRWDSSSSLSQRT